MSKSGAWIGVDLDGTLAYYGGWQGPEHIGAPIPAMLERVKRWLKEGRRVKIFTARVCQKGREHYIRAWLEQHGIASCEITNEKDYDMIELWDDRCVAVEANTGRPLSPSARGLE